MKKILSLALTICLIMSFAASFAERINYEDEKYISNIAYCGGKIFAIVNGSTLYEYKPENNELEKKNDFSDSSIESEIRIFAVNDELYAVSLPNVYKVNPDDFKLEKYKELDLSNNNTYVENVVSTQDDTAIIYTNFNNQNTEVLWLNSGNKVTLDDKYFFGFSAYKDGNIVCTSMDAKVYIIDKNSCKELYDFKGTDDFMFHAIPAYDSSTDSLYIISRNKLWTVDDNAKTTEKCFLPVMPKHGAEILFLKDSKIAYLSEEYSDVQSSIKIYDINNNDYKDKTVKVFGLDDNIISKYNSMGREFIIENGSTGNFMDQYDSSFIANNMKSQDASDVYFLRNPYSRDEFIKLDYAAELNSSSILVENSNRYYPYIRDIAYDGDRLMYIPFTANLDAIFLLYDTQILEELGFTEADLPKTYSQFVDFLLDAQSKVENAGIKIMEYADTYPIKLILTMEVINKEYAMALRDGRQFNLSDPAIKEVLNKINDADLYMFGSIDNNADNSNTYIDNTSERCLLKLGYDGIHFKEGQKPLYLSIKEGEEPFELVNVGGMILNSLSENKDKAIKFLEEFINVMELRNQVIMYSDIDEDIIDPSFIKMIEQQKLDLEKLKKSAENADEKNQKSIKEEIEFSEKNIEEMKKQGYIASKESIDDYKAHINFYYAIRKNLFDFKNEQMNKLIEQYIKKQVDTNSFLNELQRIARMADLESK